MQQANHPNRNRTFWYFSPRGFANEYVIGIASTAGARGLYSASRWERIDRNRAIRELSNRGDEATQIFCSVELDGEPADSDRFWLARAIAKGETL